MSEPTDTAVDSRRTDESNTGEVSRRTVLSSLGAGAATLGLAKSAAGEGGEFLSATTATTTATSSGPWSDPATWDNGVPADADSARIDSGVTVTVDGETNRIKTLVVDGTLTVSRDTDTHLKAETIATKPDGTLDLGTEDDPIPQGTTAELTVVHHEDISEKNDPERISKGLLLMGETAIHGAEKTNWTELATAPTAGDTELELPDAPKNWQEGDDIVVPGLNPNSNQDEERTIATVSGSTVRLDEALKHDHVPPENNLDVELTAYALNLSRNVVVQSEVQETDVTKEQRINRQGHMMVMSTAQSLHNFRLIHMGRTNKRYKIDNPRHGGESSHGDEPNPQARYALHFHMTGLGEEPHEVSGVVAQNSPGWGIVNHYSHANVRDSVTYQVYGAGFVAESGPERGAFKRCFALRSRGTANYGNLNARESHDEFGHDGNGFWFQGPGVAMDDCVAAGHSTYGFGIWGEPLYNHPKFGTDGPDTQKNYPNELAIEDGMLPEDANPDGATKSKDLPFKSFSNNTVFASAGGLEYGDFDGNSEVKKSVVDTFTVYNIDGVDRYPAATGHRRGEWGNCAVSMRYASQLKLTDPQIHNPGGHGFQTNFYSHEAHTVGGIFEGCRVGIRTNHFTGYSEYRDSTFVDTDTPIRVCRLHPHGSHATLDRHLEMSNLTFSGSTGTIDLVHLGLGAHPWHYWEDSNHMTYDGQRLYYDDQAVDYVPFESEGDVESFDSDVYDKYLNLSMSEAKDQLPGMTNAELHDEFGTCAYDELPPADTITHPDTDGGILDPVTVENEEPIANYQSVKLTGYVPADGASYEWSMGDGTTLTGPEVTYTYEEGGEYEIELTASKPDGETNTFSRTVDVRPVHQSTNPGPVSSGVKFNIKGNPAGVHPKIDLGAVDNDPYMTDMTYKGYVQVPEGGVYRCTLKVNEKGTLYIDGAKVTAAQEEYDTHNTSTGQIGLEPGLHAIRVEYSERAGGEALEVRMDGPGMSGEIPADALYHEDEDGEVIAEMPQAAFSTTNESGTTVSFDASASSAPEGSITSYEWDFGDGSTASGQTVEHTYDTSDYYDVTLTVTDDAGNTGETTTEVTVGETHEIRINGLSDQTSNYEFSVRGSIKKGEDASGQDVVEGSTVSGEIGSYQDNYRYAGEITSWSLENDVPVEITIDGEEVDPSTLGDGAGEPETVTDAIDEDDDGEIGDTEILTAVNYWQDDEPVPGTDGQTIDRQTMLELIDRWSGDN